MNTRDKYLLHKMSLGRSRKFSKTLSIAGSLVVVLFLFFSCQKEKSKSPKAVYITGSDSNLVASYSVTHTGEAVGITATASALVNQNLEVGFSADPSLVDAFNQKNSTNYKVLSPASYDLPTSTATIPAGANLSNTVNVVIKNIDSVKEGISYLLPIKIVSKSSSFPVIDQGNVLYLNINRPTITVAPRLSGSNYFRVDFSDSSRIKNLAEYTIEARVKFWGLPKYNDKNLMGILGFPAQSTNDNTSGWLFLDGTPDRLGGSGDVAAFMLGMGGWSTWTADPKITADTAKWYAVAGTLSGGKISLYVDGKFVSSVPFGAKANFGANFCIGAAPLIQNGFYLQGTICEARLWTRALSSSELSDKLHQCYVDPKSPGLEAYWRLNDGKESCQDFSGHGHTATLVKDNDQDLIQWEQVTCP